MKRFIFLLTTIFICTITYAENITINWGVDNQPYTTTTCEIGGDVILPPVSKRGHVFRGWTAEHFDRGTFADWTQVPNSYTAYSQNYLGTQKPEKGDYITITDVSDYHGAYDNEISIYRSDYNFTFVINGTTYNKRTNTQSYENGFNLAIPSIGLTIRGPWWGNTIYFQTYSDNTIPYYVLYNNTTTASFTPPNNEMVSAYYPDISITYSGTWRFVYDGVWEIDGKNGWKPVEQISNE